MCAPKPLTDSLVKMAKTKLTYLNGIGVILLQIGHEIILDKREKEVYNELLIPTYIHLYPLSCTYWYYICTFVCIILH